MTLARTFAKLLNITILFSVVMIMVGISAADTEGTIELLGIPIKAVVYGNSHGMVIPNPDGAGQTFYIPYYSTTGGALVGYDLAKNEVVKVPLGSAGGYGLAQGADGALYIGGVNGGDLYRYDPATGELANLGGSEHGNSYIWAAATSPDGNKIYGACYPTAGVLEYDVQTKELKYHGSMKAGEKYARSIEVDNQGMVWVGVGLHAHLIVLNPATGEKHSVLPEQYAGNSIVYSLQKHGKYVCATVLFAGIVLVYDATTQQVARTIQRPPDALSWMNVRGGTEDKFYLCSRPDSSLYSYEPASDELTLLVEGLGRCFELVDDRYVHVMDDQDYVLYDLAEGKEIVRSKLAEAEDGMNIFSLAADKNGNIFGSTYINMHMFGYKPESGKMYDLGKVCKWGGQVDSMTCGDDGKIYMGAYTHATVNIYDPSAPWQPGEQPDSNPRCLGPIGEGQYRTRCITHGPDGNLYLGSIPSYNSAPTGAFSRVNPNTGEKTVWLDLVPGGAVKHCISDDKYVYAAGRGKFFVWDPAADEKVYEMALAVSALALAPTGNIVGTAGSEVFIFSPDEMKIAKTMPAPTGDFTHMTMAPNGMLYGINSKSIVEINPQDWSVRQIATEGGKFLAADSQSNLYFARGTKLYRLKRE